VREAANAADGLRLSREFSPEIIVLDLRLPDGSGLDLVGSLISCELAPKVVVLSMYEDPAFAARALAAGAKGYITKNDDPNVLLQAIDAVGGGGVFLTASMAEKMALMTTNIDDDPMRDLTAREREVLDLLGQGRTVAEIADQLKISYRTSAGIVMQIKSRLNINSTAALIKWAVEQRLQQGSY